MLVTSAVKHSLLVLHCLHMVVVAARVDMLGTSWRPWNVSKSVLMLCASRTLLRLKLEETHSLSPEHPFLQELGRGLEISAKGP